jgi:hypothetical protein
MEIYRDIIAVVALLDNKGITAVDYALQNILDLYELDFSKYAEPMEIPRIHAIWHSLPTQLAKENRKFIYKVVRSGARSKDYEDALMWLEDAGIIHREFNGGLLSCPSPLAGWLPQLLPIESEGEAIKREGERL